MVLVQMDPQCPTGGFGETSSEGVKRSKSLDPNPDPVLKYRIFWTKGPFQKPELLPELLILKHIRSRSKLSFVDAIVTIVTIVYALVFSK